MTNYSAKNVDEYISAAPQEARSHFEEIRAAVKSALPEIEEKTGYGKPYYKYHGWVVGLMFLKTISALKFGMGFKVRIAKYFDFKDPVGNRLSYVQLL